MDSPSNYRQSNPSGSSSRRKSSKTPRSRPTPPSAPPQLFQDTSMSQQGPPANDSYGGYDQHVNQPAFPDQPANFGGMGNLINDPMASMAMQYGNTLADQGKDYVNKNLEKYVSTSKIKYYFAVDTSYVGRKLALISFPFTHADWSIKYNRDEPVAPRYEINAPDLYIPVMAFVTYILVAGVCLGVQNMFSPEQLGIQTSSALVWLVIEVFAIVCSLYFMNVKTDLKYLDIIAYSGYKYIGMIGSVLAGLFVNRLAYYLVLLWFALSLAFFLIRTLRVQILPHSESDSFSHGRKRSLYLIVSYATIQPILMWWITRSVVL